MKIIRNFSFLTISQAVEKVSNFLLIVALTRYLAVEEYGIYALTIAFVGMFGNLFDGGLNFLLTREIASSGKNDSRLFSKILFLKLLTGSIVFISLLVVSFLMGYDKKILSGIIIFAIATFIISFSNSFRAIFIAHERMEFESLLVVLYRLLVLLGIFFLLKEGIIFPKLMLPYVIAAMIVLFFSYYLQNRSFPLRTFDNNERKGFKLFKDALPFAAGAVMSEIYFNIDNVMLSKLTDLKTVGNYSAAYRLFFTGIIIANSLSLAIYPYFARLWSKDKLHVYNLFNIIFKILFLISIPVAFIVSFFANEIIELVFGPKYFGSASILKVLVWTLIPLYLYHITGRTLEAIGEQRFVAKSMLFNLLVNIMLNLIFIPIWGAKGAALSILLSSTLLLLTHLLFIGRKVGVPNILDSILKMILPFLGCVVTIVFMLEYVKWAFNALLGLLAYLIILYLIKGITKEEISVLFRHEIRGEG